MYSVHGCLFKTTRADDDARIYYDNIIDNVVYRLGGIR